MASFQDRVIGAMKLLPSTFEEVEHDASATSQAALIVLGAAVAGAIGMLVRGYGSMAVVGVVLALIGWGVSSVVLFFVGTRLLPGKNAEADMGQVLRATGFAQAPQLLNVFAFIPVLGFLIRLVTAVWSLVALVIAVRQALDYDDTMRAVIVCLIAWAVMIVFTFMMTILGFGATMGSSLI